MWSAGHRNKVEVGTSLEAKVVPGTIDICHFHRPAADSGALILSWLQFCSICLNPPPDLVSVSKVTEH